MRRDGHRGLSNLLTGSDGNASPGCRLNRCGDEFDGLFLSRHVSLCPGLRWDLPGCDRIAENFLINFPVA